jgi:hypothetical protein
MTLISSSITKAFRLMGRLLTRRFFSADDRPVGTWKPAWSEVSQLYRSLLRGNALPRRLQESGPDRKDHHADVLREHASPMYLAPPGLRKTTTPISAEHERCPNIEL